MLISGFQNGLAIAGDYMSAASFLGISGLVFANGFDGLIFSIGWLVGWPVITFLMAERLRNLGRFTFADVAAYRFAQKPVRLFAASGTLVVVLFYLIAQMVGAGQLIKLLFGLDYIVAVGLVGGRGELTLRRHRAVLRQPREGGRRHGLEFGGDGLAVAAQRGQADLVQVVGAHVVVAHAAGGALFVGVQHRREIAQALGRVHEHAAQLATSHHPQGGARQQHRHRGAFCAGTVASSSGGTRMARAASVWRAR